MKFYFKYRSFFDYTISISLGIAVCLDFIGYKRVFNWPSGEFYLDIMLSVCTSAASLLGFVLAANTFLISHTQHERFAILRNSKGFEQLLQIMRSSLWRLLALSICAGLASLVTPKLTQLAATFVLTLTALSLMALATLIWSTMAVLSVPTK